MPKGREITQRRLKKTMSVKRLIREYLRERNNEEKRKTNEIRLAKKAYRRKQRQRLKTEDIEKGDGVENEFSSNILSNAK